MGDCRGAASAARCYETWTTMTPSGRDEAPDSEPTAMAAEAEDRHRDRERERKFPSPVRAIGIGLLSLAALAILPRLVPPAGGMVGTPAPAFSLQVSANGKIGSRMSTEELRGRAILLDFWASWCGPCSMVAPVVDRVARRYEKKGLVVLGVNSHDTPDVVRAYASKKGLSYPMVVDAGGRASDKYGVHQLPSLVVIDREGKVRAYLTGIVDEATLSEIVAAAM